jgi:hypothetical protein
MSTCHCRLKEKLLPGIDREMIRIPFGGRPGPRPGQAGERKGVFGGRSCLTNIVTLSSYLTKSFQS